MGNAYNYFATQPRDEMLSGVLLQEELYGFRTIDKQLRLVKKSVTFSSWIENVVPPTATLRS